MLTRWKKKLEIQDSIKRINIYVLSIYMYNILTENISLTKFVKLVKLIKIVKIGILLNV